MGGSSNCDSFNCGTAPSQTGQLLIDTGLQFSLGGNPAGRCRDIFGTCSLFVGPLVSGLAG